MEQLCFVIRPELILSLFGSLTKSQITWLYTTWNVVNPIRTPAHQQGALQTSNTTGSLKTLYLDYSRKHALNWRAWIWIWWVDKRITMKLKQNEHTSVISAFPVISFLCDRIKKVPAEHFKCEETTFCTWISKHNTLSYRFSKVGIKPSCQKRIISSLGQISLISHHSTLAKFLCSCLF